MKYVLALVIFFANYAVNAQTFSAVPYVFANGQTYNPSQVMADFQSVVNSGNSVGAAINTAIGGLVSFPSGSFEFFNLTSCPAGWSDQSQSPAPGFYFVRGFDQGAGIDPGNTLGQIEASSVQNHNHTLSKLLASNASTTLASGTFGPTSFAFGASFSSNPSSGFMNSGNAGTDTYPANVLLLLCGKN